MSKKKFAIILCLIVVLIGATSLKLAYDLIAPPSHKYQPKSVYISPQTSAHEIAKQLKEEGLIKHKRLFVYYLKLIQEEKKLRSGVFILSPSYSLKRIKNILEGKEGPGGLTRITIPEGYNLAQIAEAFEDKKIVKKTDFLNYAHDIAKDKFKDQYPFLQEIPTNNIEGYLFPETYFFSKGNTLDIIFNAMLKQFSMRIVKRWEENPTAQILSLHETLTLASIIEREAAAKEESAIIASVFNNRLKKNMKLESCATILYAIGDLNKRSVLYKDLKIKSSYNTYLYPGLPPTPIASPGLHSFEAALTPAQTDFYFFVAKGDHTHYFSKTLKEHNRLKNQIQRGK